MKGKMPLLFTRLLISKKKGVLCWLIRLLSEKVKYRKLKKKKNRKDETKSGMFITVEAGWWVHGNSLHCSFYFVCV